MRTERILMLAPCFRASTFGGVQRSGALAWEVAEQAGAKLVQYGTNCAGGCRHSKWRTALGVVAARSGASTVVVWHVGLAKLLPLLGGGRRVVVFLHGIECWRRLDVWTQRALRAATEFWSNSDFTWQQFVEWNPEFRRCQYRVVPLGEGEVEARRWNPEEPPTAVILGRMDRREDYKGHRELIGIWPEVREILPGARLEVIGDGDLRPELEELTEAAGVKESVRFHGLLSEEEKLRVMRACRCLLMPSRGEGFGLAYLEAMRLGRPCLVSLEDAGRAVVNPPEAGLAANPMDRAELKEMVVRLMKAGTEWDELSDRARARYEYLYTAERFRQRFTAALLDRGGFRSGPSPLGEQGVQ